MLILVTSAYTVFDLMSFARVLIAILFVLAGQVAYRLFDRQSIK